MADEIKFGNDSAITIKGTLKESSSPSFKKDGSIDCQEIIETYTYTSKKSYTPEECLAMCTGNSTWNDEDVVKDKNWLVNSIICLKIKSDDNKNYISYQKIIDKDTLEPIIYNIQSSDKQFIALSKDGILYCNTVAEGSV